MSKRNVWLLALACVVAACSSQSQFGTDAGSDVAVVDAGAQVVTDEFTLRSDLQSAWIDDVAWTRFYVIAAVSNLPEAPTVLARLHANQDRIANVVRPFIRDNNADHLTELLQTHVALTERIVAAVVTNDPNLVVIEATWYTNADDIAGFLSMVNSSLDEGALKAQLRKNLDQTVAEAQARVAADWNRDVSAADGALANITTMSNALASGFFTEFRPQINPTTMSQKEETFAVTQQMLWDERALWMRNVIVSQTSRLADFDVAKTRVLRNQVEIGDSFRPFYGDATAAQLTTLLQNDVNAALATLVGIEGRRDTNAEAAKAAWYANANAIAQLLASINPNWALADLQSRFRQLVDTTFSEMNARIGKNWQGDVSAYDTLVTQSLALSDVVTHGIAQQFPDNLR